MGRIYNAAGTEVSQATFLTAPYTTAVVQPSKYTVNQTVYERDSHPGHKKQGAGAHGNLKQSVKYNVGQVITQVELDNMFVEGSFTLMAPMTGPIVGGTAVTLTGSGFTEATGVTFGGVAATNVNVVDDTKITCTTPATTAGAKAVLVLLAAGNVACGNYTYV